MAGSNIFMQLITGAGPVIGEGLLEGWQGSIELRSFDWGMSYEDDHSSASLLQSAAGMFGVADPARITMNELTFEKRFDVASSQIHFCCDNELPVLSASITVLHIKHGGRAIHQPGFVLLAMDGKIKTVDLSAQSGGNGVELVEKVTMSFKAIEMTYLKTFDKDSVPMAPFVLAKDS